MSRKVLGVDKELETRTVMNLECVLDKRARRLPQSTKTRVAAATSTKGKGSLMTGGREVEYERTFSSRRLFAVGSGYLSLKGIYLLIGLTASLLILPLVLPPLPPPPFMLLLLPICILACLMILAFMPSSNARDLTRVNDFESERSHTRGGFC